jgi:hypothetical protein
MLSRFESVDQIDTDLCKKVTNRTRDEFALIVSNCLSLRNSPCRTKAQALAVYLFWIRYGLSQELVGLFFGISSIQRVSDYIAQALVRELLPIMLTIIQKYVRY